MFEVPRQIKSADAGTSDVAVNFVPLAEIDFHRIWSNIWRGKSIILRTVAASLLVAIVFIVVVPSRYTAVTQILIDPTDLHAVGNDLVPASQLSDLAVLQVESQVRVLTSDSVLRRVIKAEALDRDPEFAGPPSPLRALANSLIRPLGLGTPAGADPAVAAMNMLRRHLQVKRAERTYVVDVGVTSHEREKAARIANAIAQAYLLEQTQVRSDAARQVSQSLTARLKELKDRVREAEDRVEAFKARNNIVGASGQLVNEQQLSELNNQLGVARARTAEAKARLDQVERLRQSKGDIGAFPEAVQSQTITALRSQYAEIMRREAEQVTSLGPRHPAVVDIQAQAERLRRMIDEELNRIALSARSEYESARANEAALERNLDALKHNTLATNEAMVTLRELERDVQASRTVYESFLVRARETGEQQLLDTKNIRVISPADLPLSRSFPPSLLLTATAALIVGVAAGIGFIFLRAPRDEAAPRPSATPVTSSAPERVDRDRLPGADTAAAVPVLAVLPDLGSAADLKAVGDPKSPVTKEIRKVHEALRASHKKRGNPSVLVVAFNEEDDTAAVAINLAAATAATHQVLLIDTDLERRTLSAVKAGPSQAGLVDVALGHWLLSDVVVRDRETNINVLPFVSPNSRRDRQIKDEDIKVAFAQTKHYELVIVAAMDRDPSGRFFAGLVDHIVVVAKADAVGQGTVDQLVARFGLDARKIRGAVLTGAKQPARANN